MVLTCFKRNEFLILETIDTKYDRTQQGLPVAVAKATLWQAKTNEELWKVVPCQICQGPLIRPMKRL